MCVLKGNTYYVNFVEFLYKTVDHDKLWFNSLLLIFSGKQSTSYHD